MAVKQEDYVFQMKNEPEDFRQEILGHYALFLQYYWGEGPLSQLTLAHYIFIDCAVYPREITLYNWNKKVLSNFDLFYGKTGGFDKKAATNKKTSKNYCLTKAKDLLQLTNSGVIPQKSIMKLFDAIVPQNTNLKMVWDVSLQNMAKVRGEFKKRLSLALQSEELKKMPEPIREINEYHLKELLEMYRLGIRCPDCKWEIPCLRGIALLIGGDEKVLNYLQCEQCSKYFIKESIEGIREAEPGYAESEGFYEVKKKQAKKDLAAIKKCPNPYDEHCKCKIHLDYFDSG